MDAGSTPKGMLIYSGRTVLQWSNFRNSFGYFFGSPYLALSMTVLFFFFSTISFVFARCTSSWSRSFQSQFSLMITVTRGDFRYADFFFEKRWTVASADNLKIKILEISSREFCEIKIYTNSKSPVNFPSKIYEVNCFLFLSKNERSTTREIVLAFVSKIFEDKFPSYIFQFLSFSLPWVFNNSVRRNVQYV